MAAAWLIGASLLLLITPCGALLAKKDCHPEPDANQQKCEARGCIWQPSNVPGEPWCYYKDGGGGGGGGGDVPPENERKDCHPEPNASQQKCEARGCIWLPSNTPGVPWCFYKKGGGGGNNTPAPPKKKVDCYPEPGSNEQGCKDRGCIWEPSNVPGEPWCYYKDGKIPSPPPPGQSGPEAQRIDCQPEGNANRGTCERRGCVWSDQTKYQDQPRCSYSAKSGYKKSSGSGNSYQLEKGSTGSPYGGDISPVSLNVEKLGTTLRVKISASNRIEVPVSYPRGPGGGNGNLEFEENTNTDFFSFKIKRPGGATVFDTSIGGFVFSDQYLQIAGMLPSTSFYGLGENSHKTLKHKFNRYTVWNMFSRDRPPGYGPSGNTYSVFPVYMVLEQDGKASGFMLLNSNAMDAFTGPAPFVGFRTIGGILDMYFFPGPTPEEVVQQYTALVGKPMLPAYFALGFQLCRYGYRDLNDVKQTVNRNLNAGIPLDVQYVDIDHMDRQKDFTIGPAFRGLGAYARELHSRKMKLTLIFDPDIDATYDVFNRGKAKNVFIQWPRKSCVPGDNNQYPSTRGTNILLGKVWPENKAGFPDFMKQATHDWWTDEFVRFHRQVEFDAAWIDMNEPANFQINCPTNCLTDREKKLEHPPYQTFNGYLAGQTICMASKQGSYYHYDVHSIYGHHQGIATLKALEKATGKRGYVVSRSLFPGSGAYVGHWTGDNSANWEHLRMAVLQPIEWNIFGVPYIGSDICGFNGEPSEELCLRWMQLGAFHSYSRNHNGKGYRPQDPANWASVARASKKALQFRYKYMATLYSLHQAASQNGGTVLRGLFMNYPTDTNTHDISYQFMWGDKLLVTPVVEERRDSVRGYFPQDTWYSVYDYDYGKIVSPGYHDLRAPTSSNPPLHTRGGTIMVGQEPGMNTAETREREFELLISPDANQEAVGELYWDDGESPVSEGHLASSVHHIGFHFKADKEGGKLSVTKHLTASNVQMPPLERLEVLGYKHSMDLTSFAVNGEPVAALRSFDFNESTGRTFVTFERPIDLNGRDGAVISWNHE